MASLLGFPVIDMAAAAGKKMSKKQPDSERFRSRKKALDWLLGNGHKISTGKFYQDCKAGYPMVAPDGSVSKYQVLTYGNELRERVTPDMSAINSKEFDLRKAEADAKIAEMKATKMEREQDRLWLHADDAWSVVAGLVGNLRDAIRHQLYTSQREIVHTGGGDQDRSQEVYEFVETVVDRAFNEVAGSELKITFDKEVKS